MPRVPSAIRENMDAIGQAIWDEIETSRGGVARNYAAMLNNPQAAGAMAAWAVTCGSRRRCLRASKP